MHRIWRSKELTNKIKDKTIGDKFIRVYDAIDFATLIEMLDNVKAS